MKLTKILLIFLIGFTYLYGNAQKKEKDSLKDDIDHRFYINNVDINNKYSSFGPTFYGSDMVAYTAQNEKKERYNIFVGTVLEDGEIGNPQMLKGLSSKSFESNATFTKDGKHVYFTRSLYGIENTVKIHKDVRAAFAIFTADISSNGKWKNVRPVPFNSTEYDVGHPTLSADDKKLYFTSNMSGGFGGADIYFVDILNDGSYSKPENMGKYVNSKFKEVFPHIKDNILYFSSDRTDGGLGGLDIYAVKILAGGKISKTLHLDPPVNSIADDMSYIYNPKKQIGYFSSNRKRGQGSDDIYSFKETRPLIFECFQKISGEIVDLSGNPLPFAEVVLYDVFNKEVGTFKTEKDGKFLFENMLCSANYKIIATKRRLGTKEINFVTKSTHNADNHFTITLSDDFIVMKRGKKMLNIFSIYFAYDSSKITPTAEMQLTKVALTMRKYPNMVIELGAHTDARGGDAYNLKLSKARAASTVNYLINHGGILSDRISGEGYGETRLLNDCDNTNKSKCTKQEHQINRRSEFIITKM